MLSDLELLDAWCEGDGASGERLIERNFPKVYRFFANKAADDIEELVQETFLRCVENRDRFEGRSSFSTFLFGIARNVLCEHLRRLRSTPVDFGVTSLQDLRTTPSSVVARGEEAELLTHALRRIPVDLQLMLELHYWEDLPTAEIAEIVEIPRGTVKSRLHRGRAAVAAELAGLTGGVEISEEDVDSWARRVAGTLAGIEKPGRGT